eukprot:76870-Pleurochrysis_carterae.AAC.2
MQASRPLGSAPDAPLAIWDLLGACLEQSCGVGIGGAISLDVSKCATADQGPSPLTFPALARARYFEFGVRPRAASDACDCPSGTPGKDW